MLAGIGWILAYLALALKRVYGGPWSGVLLRGAVLLVAYWTPLALVLVPWMLAAVVLA